jgi:hypothetical protein
MINFCAHSLGSSNPKTVQTASIVVFNHLVTLKGDIKSITTPLFAFLQKVM